VAEAWKHIRKKGKLKWRGGQRDDNFNFEVHDWGGKLRTRKREATRMKERSQPDVLYPEKP